VWLAGLVGLGTVACTAPPAAAPVAQIASPAPADSSQLTVDTPQVLADRDGLVVDVQRWRIGDRAGLAWRVRAPRDVVMDVVPSERDVPFSELLPAEGAWAAINGGFYEDHTATGLVVSDGVSRSPTGPRGGSGVVAWGPEPVRVVHVDAWAEGPREAVQSVDRLVDAGVSLVGARAGRPRAARSAIAVAQDAVWLVVLAEDASLHGASSRDTHVQLAGTSGYGMTLAEFADYLVQATAAQQALNLDGAISSQLAAEVGDVSLRVLGEHTTINAIVVRAADSSR
jgi:hypothetical protein